MYNIIQDYNLSTSGGVKSSLHSAGTEICGDSLLSCYDSLVVSFPEEGLLPTTLTSLYIVEFEYLKSLNGWSLQQLTSLERLSILHCGKLLCLPNKRLPSSLRYLYIHYCPLLERRCQIENGQDWHKIAHTYISCGNYK
ncbi:hypothetical protein TIFTF001_038549 [Ficus carica]|uniref:Uncharacterized protein n=1 Tax=Ficus carica TaxID=3494 RepID=A0AA88JD16_FICCA|nr:hypothetical protein TIFTF001_038549 [Ficus carica]